MCHSRGIYVVGMQTMCHSLVAARRVVKRRVCCIRRRHRKREGAMVSLANWCHWMWKFCFILLRELESFCACMTLFALMTCVVIHGVSMLNSEIL